MSSFWERLLTKKDWRLVKTVTSGYHITNNLTKAKIKEGCELTYYLFENQFGDRKFDVADSEQGDLKVSTLDDNDYVFRCKDYRDTIKPWVAGGYNPEIPNYYSVEHKDLLDTLRGRKK